MSKPLLFVCGLMGKRRTEHEHLRRPTKGRNRPERVIEIVKITNFLDIEGELTINVTLLVLF